MIDIKTKFGFSLVELTVIVLILGILATFAIPNFIKAAERTKEKEAISFLHQIRAAEIVYRSEENTFWPAGSIETDPDTIDSALNTSLDTRELNWDFSITAAANTFTATAQRTSGRNAGETITIDENGEIGGTWSP